MIVQSTLLYASETWALPKQQLHRLEVFQMKCLRKICKVSLKDKIRNEIILGWCNAARVSNIVSHRRLRWLGHLARMPDERLPKRVLFGHMDGSGVRGRSQKQFIHSSFIHYTLSNPQIRCVAADILWQPSSLPCLGISSTM